MERIPFPTLHTGLTPDDIPYGYSMFPSIWDDLSGYEPRVVGHETDDAGRMVILVALSPWSKIATTVVSAGQTPEAAGEAVLEAVRALRSQMGRQDDAGVSVPQGRPA